MIHAALWLASLLFLGACAFCALWLLLIIGVGLLVAWERIRDAGDTRKPKP